MRTADLIFFTGTGWQPRLIRWAQAARPSLRPYAGWTHCALCTGHGDQIISSTTRGVYITTLSTVMGKTWRRVSIDASEIDRREAMEYARSRLHTRYGKLQILSVGAALLTGGTLAFQIDGSATCSQLCTEALQRCGYIFPHDAESMTPADLAWYFTIPSEVS
jgi:hypothetical protein